MTVLLAVENEANQEISVNLKHKHYSTSFNGYFQDSFRGSSFIISNRFSYDVSHVSAYHYQVCLVSICNWVLIIIIQVKEMNQFLVWGSTFP